MDGLEDDFPLQMDVFFGSMLIFRNVSGYGWRVGRVGQTQKNHGYYDIMAWMDIDIFCFFFWW